VTKNTEKETVTAYFKADISHYVPGRNDERHENPPSKYRTVIRTRELPKTQLGVANKSGGEWRVSLVGKIV
jgi:hypothetical protein